jgi:hypothetical protein
MKAAFADVVPALRALLVALAGVLLALWWFQGDWELSLALVAALALAGAAAEWLGDRFLPSHPVAAVMVMEWWVLVPMAVASAASAALIVIAVELAVPESVTDPIVKEATGAIAGGLSAFLTAAFVSSIGDRDKSGIGDRIKDRLRRHYAREVKPGQKRVVQIPAEGRIELLLYSDFQEGLSGWDRETRIVRAGGIAKALPR